MPLSSVIGAQSIIRPGVCTSSTRPASPYDGQVIYETDTDKTLVWNGTGWVFLSTSRANAGGLDLVKTQTIGTGVSSVTVSDAFSSTYDNYRVLINVTSASGDVNLLAQLGTGTATTTNYKSYLSTTFVSWTSGAGATQTNTTGLQAGFTGAGANSCTFDVNAPNLARPTFAFGHYGTSNNGGFTASTQTDSTQFTSLHVLPASGTLTGGTIRVYGYVNS